MAGKSPAFQLYTADFMASPKVAVMTNAEVGSYLFLLCSQWENSDCSLPDDDTSLARLSRAGRDWKKHKAKVLACFEPVEGNPGRIRNPRLLSERIKQELWRERKSKGGKKGADSRWHSHEKPDGIPIDSEIGKPSVSQCQNMAFHSPLSTFHSSSSPPTPSSGGSDDLNFPNFQRLVAAYPKSPEDGGARALEYYLADNPGDEKEQADRMILGAKILASRRSDPKRYMPDLVRFLHERRWANALKVAAPEEIEKADKQPSIKIPTGYDWPWDEFKATFQDPEKWKAREKWEAENPASKFQPPTRKSNAKPSHQSSSPTP